MSNKYNYLFVYSKQDPAGNLLADTLRNSLRFKAISEFLWAYEDLGLLKVEEDIIYTDNLEDKYKVNSNTIIFLSRHSSSAKRKTLSVHVSGNPGVNADYGGLPRTLPPSEPTLMKTALLNIYKISQEYNLVNYDVTLEVTHHGPSCLKTPSFFVEIGSSPKEWRDEKAAQVIIDALLESIKEVDKTKSVPCIGIGGPHYAPSFTRKVLYDKYAVGHIISKYVINEIDESIIIDALKKTMDAKVVLIDWKGLKGESRRRIIGYLERINGLKIIKI